jgi:hypothetical protein
MFLTTTSNFRRHINVRFDYPGHKQVEYSETARDENCYDALRC